MLGGRKVFLISINLGGFGQGVGEVIGIGGFAWCQLDSLLIIIDSRGYLAGGFGSFSMGVGDVGPVSLAQVIVQVRGTEANKDKGRDLIGARLRRTTGCERFDFCFES